MKSEPGIVLHDARSGELSWFKQYNFVTFRDNSIKPGGKVYILLSNIYVKFMQKYANPKTVSVVPANHQRPHAPPQ